MARGLNANKQTRNCSYTDKHLLFLVFLSSGLKCAELLNLSPFVADALQVIYSLNMKNEEQEAALQALSHAHHDELHRILMETCHEGEGSALRTRLLELQESLDEQQRVGAQVCARVSPCL